jgi:hypothetical protein
VENQPLKSKAVRAIRYDAATRSLDVEFASASTYRYFDVPRDVYEWLLRVGSKGRFLKYRYERLDSDGPRPDDDLESLLRDSLRPPPKSE